MYFSKKTFFSAHSCSALFDATCLAVAPALFLLGAIVVLFPPATLWLRKLLRRHLFFACVIMSRLLQLRQHWIQAVMRGAQTVCASGVVQDIREIVVIRR